MRSRDFHRRTTAAFAGALCAGAASAQLRVANWNISFYAGGRQTDIERAVYAEFEGRSMRPDIILGEEFLSQAAVDSFRTILNAAPGSPGDWQSAPFIDGPDTDSAFFYRASKVVYLGATIAAYGSTAPGDQPRHTYRYDLRPVGYTAPEATLACYASHMKSGTSSSDQARRLVEAQRIRADAAALPQGWNFLLGGDFNIQSSNQSAYQTLIGLAPTAAGMFFDPIATPGSWNNNAAFRFVHTQDPVGAGGMDDRHDQILLCAALVDGDGFDYIGAPATPYSTATWNDPNHSYRAWGNDGATFDLPMAIANNQMVGPVIAQAIVNAAAGGGHLPVFLDLRVPPEIQASESIDFGVVALHSPAPVRSMTITHAGDLALWGAAGVSTLLCSFEASPGFNPPPGVYAVLPGDSVGLECAMSTAALGPRAGSITVHSNAPDAPLLEVPAHGLVVISLLPGDANGDQRVDFLDLNIVLSNYGGFGAPAVIPGDLDFDGDVDFLDLNILLGNYGAGA